jgi:hypothetical protein
MWPGASPFSLPRVGTAELGEHQCSGDALSMACFKKRPHLPHARQCNQPVATEALEIADVTSPDCQDVIESPATK